MSNTDYTMPTRAYPRVGVKLVKRWNTHVSLALPYPRLQRLVWRITPGVLHQCAQKVSVNTICNLF